MVSTTGICSIKKSLSLILLCNAMQIVAADQPIIHEPLTLLECIEGRKDTQVLGLKANFSELFGLVKNRGYQENKVRIEQTQNWISNMLLAIKHEIMEKKSLEIDKRALIVLEGINEKKFRLQSFYELDGGKVAIDSLLECMSKRYTDVLTASEMTKSFVLVPASKSSSSASSSSNDDSSEFARHIEDLNAYVEAANRVNDIANEDDLKRALEQCKNLAARGIVLQRLHEKMTLRLFSENGELQKQVVQLQNANKMLDAAIEPWKNENDRLNVRVDAFTKAQEDWQKKAKELSGGLQALSDECNKAKQELTAAINKLQAASKVTPVPTKSFWGSRFALPTISFLAGGSVVAGFMKYGSIIAAVLLKFPWFAF